MVEPRLPKEKVVELGDRIFEQRIRELVKDRDPKLFVAIDVDSGDYEVGEEMSPITDALRVRRPEAQIFCRSVGSRHTVRFGWRGVNQNPRS